MFGHRNGTTKAIPFPLSFGEGIVIAGDIKEFFENVNNEPRVRFRHRKGQAPSSTRNEVYNSFTAPRGCPSIQQLFHLPIVKHEDWVILDDEGFNFAQAGEDHFIPTVSSVEQLTDLTLRWMNAALSKGKNHLFAIKLDFGWVGEICLDGVWYEVIPRSTNPFNYEQRMIARNTAIRRLKDRLKVDYTADTQMFLEHFGTMPERLNTTVDGQYQLPEGSQQTRAEVGAESNEQPVRPATAQASSTSQREQAKPRLDWSDLL